MDKTDLYEGLFLFARALGVANASLSNVWTAYPGMSLCEAPSTDGGVVVIVVCPTIRSHLLTVFNYPNIDAIVIRDTEVCEIINRHLAGDRDLLMCQDELIEAGFEKWAKV